MICTSDQNTNICREKATDKAFSKLPTCEAISCNFKATEKISISAGKFGTIDLFVCKKCIEIFKEEE